MSLSGTPRPSWRPKQSRRWYAERSHSAAQRFLQALDQGIRNVLEAPERWPKHRHGCRRYVFPDPYPFTLVYRRVSDVVEIVAVAHQKRRPDYWKRR